MPQVLSEVNWAAPWLRPYRAMGEALALRWQVLGGREGGLAEAANQVLDAWPDAAAASVPSSMPSSVHSARPRLVDGRPLRFVPQAAMPAGEGYERFIQRSACLPTRDNLHDFFHALVWLHCPGLKARMQALAMCELLRQRPGEPRGSVRDALTLLDENGALFWGDEPIWQALCARDWPAAFGRWHATTAPHSGPDVAGEALNGGELGVPGERQGDAHGEGVPALQVVGHALLEKLTRPRKSLCAHLWQLDGPPEVGAQPRDSELQAKPHAVLPLLGVPGWWADNLLPGFYDDASVFRPAMKPFGAKGSLSKAT